MKIKLTVSLAGPHQSYSAGDVAEFENAEAIRLIEGGFATAVRSEVTENAALKAGEKAIRRQ